MYEDVARDTNRGHTVRAVSESFQQAKDAGFKVVSHMMPDLPNVDFERDIEQFVVSPSNGYNMLSKVSKGCELRVRHLLFCNHGSAWGLLGWVDGT